jgi:hypothetical protein
MAVFHSLKYSAILALAANNACVPGDLYYACDDHNLYICATDGSVAPAAGIIMSGGITGEPGPAGAASTVPGPQGEIGPQGPDGEGASSNLTIQSGNYSTVADDGTVLCTGAVAQTITLLSTGISAGQKFTVTALSTATATVTVVSENAETIENEDSTELYCGDSADFCWTGSNWVVQ